MEKSKEYFLGLDIGTNSIGWAVTDTNYNLIKIKGKDYWGSYLFDEASPASSRRQFRSQRRRYGRVKQRIALLQDIFSEEMYKVDPSFFLRLKESKYVLEDKDEQVRYKDALFHDALFNDKDFYKKYPTIYHLRYALINEETAKDIKDIRLVYLAIHHIMKSRGHFLFEGQSFNVSDNNIVRNSFNSINALFDELNQDGDSSSDDIFSTFDLEHLDEVIKVLVDSKTTKRDKERILKDKFNIKKSANLIECIKAIIGSKVNVSKLFNISQDEKPETNEFQFDSAKYQEEIEGKLEKELSEDQFEIVNSLKAIYDWTVLYEILKDSKYISEAMVNKYNQHRFDLKQLKDYCDSYGVNLKNKIFRKCKDVDNYAAYIGSDRGENVKKISKDKFYTFLKKEIKDEDILNKIELGVFLPKLREGTNGVIPHQLHKMELEAILNNVKCNFPFLANVSDDLSNIDKIIKLFEFRIPYYIGPLNDAHAKDGKGFSWAVRNPGMQNIKVTPWNFDKVIDKDETQERFITRMTNKCTYLTGCDVLPKNSILYSKFSFLNEINNIKVLSKPLDKNIKDELFAKAVEGKKITKKFIIKTLENNGFDRNILTDADIEGIDKEVKTSLGSIKQMKAILGEGYTEEIAENIIKWITIMSDKTDVVNRVKKTYKLDNEQLKKIKGLNYSGWGRLSKEFLTELESVVKDGEVLNIIDAMEVTGLNLMQLLSNDYDYLAKIKQYNTIDDNTINHSSIDELYCSPAVKKAIWKTIVIVKEITNVMGCNPKRIFVEMARGSEDDIKKGKNAKPRKMQMEEHYRKLDCEELKKELGETSDNKFLSDKIFLYFSQMGKCAYSGKPINISDVFDTNILDIDHIYPQSKVKDDSLDNRVLVYKTENAKKGDKYPVSSDIQHKMKSYWQTLLKNNLISERKYSRLTRTTELSNDELADFISRQLVETRQSTKCAAQILDRMLEDTEIVYSKARNVSEFRNYEFGPKDSKEKMPEFVKVRDINDLHHAKDAYLNIVVGNVYRMKFNKDPKKYINSRKPSEYYLKHIFDYEVKGAWKPTDYQRIAKICGKNTCRVVRSIRKASGELFNATIYNKGKNDNLIPLKANDRISDTSKYGGYDSASTAYFSLVLFKDKKGKEVRVLEAIPTYIDKLGENAIKDHILKNNDKLTFVKVLMKEIKLSSLLKINGAYYWITGKTNRQIRICNSNQLIVDYKTNLYFKKLISYKNKKKDNSNLKINEYLEISEKDNIELYDILINKLQMNPYSNMSINQQYGRLIEIKQDFIALSIENQIDALLEILKLFKCNPESANLKIINSDAPANAGVILHSKEFKSNEEFILINQSPTGVFKEIIDLNKLV